MNVATELKKAKALEKQGHYAEAVANYRGILNSYPKNKNARDAIQRLREPPAQKLAELSQLYQQGRMRMLLERAQQVVQSYPDSARVWTFLGAAALDHGQADLAVTAFSKAAGLTPKQASAQSNLGAAYEQQGAFDAAAACFERACALAPQNADHWFSKGLANLAAGHAEAAEADLRACLARAPNHIEAVRGLAQALGNQGKTGDAIDLLADAPSDPELRVDLAELLIAAGQLDAASDHLRCVLAERPEHVRALSAQGEILLTLGQPAEAVACLDRAVQHQPQGQALWNNLSSARLQAGDPAGAQQAAEAALALNPAYAKAHHSLGNAHQALGTLDLAIQSYDTALTHDPGLEAARAQMWYFKALACDWSDESRRPAEVKALGLGQGMLPPFTMLGMEDAPERQLARSRRFARQWTAQRPVFTPRAERGRLRIGYLSSDVYDHATLSLLNGVIEAHDHSRFEIVVYGLNAPRPSSQADRLRSNVDLFRDLHGASDSEIIAQARADGLDIAVDLKGYTKDARPGPFFAGLAPVQVNYLGYPGTLGSDVFDYIIADDVLIPPEHRGAYDEAVLYMPHSYQPNDRHRVLGPPPTRKACGLPEDAVVLSCFNNNYKITAKEFDIWMRCLRAVDDAVLWLLDGNPYAASNLRREAEARGVTPERLIFAPKMSVTDHLARVQLADLFLDTFNFNAHTTGSDALFAGVPLVTCPGAQFSARVAASLCHAVGMSDTVTGDLAAYEAMILDLAQNGTKRAALRKRLAAQLPTAPLFDTDAYTRDLETAFDMMWTRWQSGAAPSDLRVPRSDG